MLPLIAVVFTVSCTSNAYIVRHEPVVFGTDLVLTFLNSLPQYMNFSDHGEQLQRLKQPFGYGQLTDLMGMKCPKFMEHFDLISGTCVPEIQKYSSVIDRLSSILKIDLRGRPVQIFLAYDVFVSQISMGLPVNQSIQEMMPEIKMAADTAFDLLFGNQTMLPLQAGLLLKEFFEVSYAAMAGEPSPKVRIYSGHDINVYALEAITRVMPQGAPPYAALFALELRRVRDTGRHVVLPVYVSTAGEPVQYLQVKGCDLLCDLDRFYEITSSDLIDVDEWKRHCNYDRNAKFHTNGFE